MLSHKKNVGLWIALAFTLIATVWMAMQDQDDAEPLVPVIRKSTALTLNSGRENLHAEQASGALLNGFHRQPIVNDPFPLFSSTSEMLAETTPSIAEPQGIPTIPFTYVGKLMDEGNYTVFLLSGDRSLAVKKGDVLEEVWRIKSINPPVMVMTYLPLKINTSLAIGNATTLGESN